jgi:4-aminobutyrate aminotransferase
MTGDNQKPDRSEGDINLSHRRQEWLRQQVDPESQDWLQADARYFLHQSLSTPCLNVLKSCSGSSFTDLQGRAYLDFHGNSVHQVGFSNPYVLEAVKKQLKSLSFSPRRYTNLSAIALAQKLAELAPGDLSKVLFAPGGTSAVGMALKLARLATGRHKTISMWDSFHGASLDAISLGGEALFRKDIGPLLCGTEHVPPADPLHCLWDPEGRCESCGLKCARYIEYIMEREGDVAAVVAEPIRCTAVNPPPKGYWPRVREICNHYGALLIFDETAICLGRTGKMFACEHDNVVPDIMVVGKGIGGGIFPLAGIIARDHLNIASDKALGHYTHEKNPVACAAGLAAIEFIEREDLLDHANRLGRRLLQMLRTLKKRHFLIKHVRCVGLLAGVELASPSTRSMTAADMADQLLYACLKRGLSFKVSQGRVLTLVPPLILTDRELDKALTIMDQSLTEVETTL